VHEIAEHTHYVQGVAWDPLNEYIATQSSDRSMHIYRIYTKQGGAFEAHAVGKNTRFPHLHTRTARSQSQSKPKIFRAESTASDAESTVSEQKDEIQPPPSSTSTGGASNSNHPSAAPLTPSTSVASTPSTSMFPPPPIDKPSSRRSSFSGSNAPGSPLHYGRFGRSPSPMPALPAIRPLPAVGAATWASVKLYGDESFTNFFRRLTFSPDGGLLLTPAGQFEDPTAIVPNDSRSSSSTGKEEAAPVRGRKGGLSVKTNTATSANTASEAVSDSSSVSSVYIYSRANFARPPIAQLPGHKKASVAVRFSPILYELRPGVSLGNSGSGSEPIGVLERGVDGSLPVTIVGPLTSGDGAKPTIVAPAPLLAGTSPALSPMEMRPPTPAMSKPPTPAQHGSGGNSSGSGPVVTATGSVFALPYRMLFAVETMDTVTIYDTQQSGPVCMLTKLHYDEFTDMSW
jgi:chromatin assembly factor 1 subunit B